MTDVIDWEEAMQQCGEDEEFLRELLGDLRNELETQVTKINGIIQNPQDAPYQAIMRAAHVVKGAAANLMCHQLQTSSMKLEKAANVAHNVSLSSSITQQHQADVQQYFTELQQSSTNYCNYLNSIGI